MDMDEFKARFEHTLAAFANGEALLLTDDPGRENEADLVVHADKITQRQMAMMIRDGSGIVCLCLTERLAMRLALPDMVEINESAHATHFTVSIDARHGISTGVSASDRVRTIRSAVAPAAQACDLVRPGHVFPLIAAPGGVLQRPGHTEGSVDLALLAALYPAVVICELMNPDGSMARGADIHRYAEIHQIKHLSIADIILYRKTYR